MIGAGVIGLEVAAAAVERGCTVHVIELANQAMARLLPHHVAAALVGVHVARGVNFRFGSRVAALEGDEAVSGVRLETGETLECDLVVFGVGVRPRTELAEAAGLTVDNGICTNDLLQTDDSRIFASGDVCRYPSVLFGRPLRLENWRNAEHQADIAARNMLGQNNTYDEVPWFWSNQYDLALQVAGLPALGHTLIMREDAASQTFLSVDCDGILRGAAALGPVKDVAPRIREARAAIAAGQRVQPTATDYPLEQLPP